MEMTPKDTRKRHPKAKFRRAGVNSKNRSGLHYKAKKQLEHSVGTAEPTLGKKMGAPFRSNTHPIEQVGFLVVLLYFCHCSESYTYFSDIQYFQRLSLRFHFEEFLYWLNPTSSRFVLHLMENTVQLLITGQETAACSAMQYWSAGLQTGKPQEIPLPICAYFCLVKAYRHFNYCLVSFFRRKITWSLHFRLRKWLGSDEKLHSTHCFNGSPRRVNFLAEVTKLGHQWIKQKLKFNVQ